MDITAGSLRLATLTAALSFKRPPGVAVRMASGELRKAVLVKGPASKFRSTRTTIWMVLPGATLLKLQFRLLLPAARVAGQPRTGLPFNTALTWIAGVVKPGMPVPGEGRFRMPGRLSLRFSVGMVRWLVFVPVPGVVTVMRQYRLLSLSRIVAWPGKAIQVVPSRDAALAMLTCAWPATTGVPTVLAVAQSAPPAWLPSGGCGPALAGKPSRVSAWAPEQAVLLKVSGPLMPLATRVCRRTVMVAPTPSVPALVARQTTRRKPVPAESLPPSVQVQPGVCTRSTPTNCSSLRMVSITRSGVAPVDAEYTAAATPLLVTTMSLFIVLPAARGPPSLVLATLRSAYGGTMV